MLLACGPVKADQAGSLQVQRREPARCTCSTVFVGCRGEWRWMKDPIHPFTKWSLSQAHVLAGSKGPGTQVKGWAGRGYSPAWMEGPYPSTYIFTVTVCTLLYSLCSCCERLPRILNIIQKTRWKWLHGVTSHGRLELTELFCWWIRSPDRRIGTEGPRSPA